MKTRFTNLLPLVVAPLLAALPAVAADRGGNAGGYTTGSVGFLEPSREPPLLTMQADPTFDFICEAAQARLPLLHCPYAPALNLTNRNFQPPSQIGQYLPHLHITILMDTIEHVATAGGGIDNNADLNQFWLSWAFESDVAVFTQPDPTTAFPVFIEPDETWAPPQPRPIWNAQIENGCSPTTHVDLQMHSEVNRDGGGLGEVDLQDSFVGNGYYYVRYTVQAVEDDEAADFVFRGHLIAYCTDYLDPDPG